jgi:hypothetical protein
VKQTGSFSSLNELNLCFRVQVWNFPGTQAIQVIEIESQTLRCGRPMVGLPELPLPQALWISTAGTCARTRDVKYSG